MFTLKFRVALLISFLSFFLLSCSFPINMIHDEPLSTSKGVPDVSVTSEDQVNVKENGKESSSAAEEDLVHSSESSNSSSEINSSNGDQQRQAQEQENMDQALELLGQSQIQWEKGNLDKSLSLLDQAYSLILDVDGEPRIAWQKDDLRFMIAKRILEIYTSRSNVAIGYQSEIPFVMNADVKKEIRHYQHGERGFFINSYKRSGRYRPLILEKLKEAGLPEELSWLPLVESGFKIKALSSARALGLWQFIPSTGYKFGLKRDHWIDERMDPEKSTQAAIAFMKSLHEIFGDWQTVLAAYNCGEGRVLRVISRQHMNYLDNFWDLYNQLPIETAQYVPRFIAVLHIIKNPKKYGIDLPENIDKPIDYEVVKTNKCMRLKDISHHLKVPDNELAALNSELRFKVTPDKEYDLKIPRGTAERFALVVNQIPKSKLPGSARYVRHRIRRGESLSTIARKYGSSVRAIVRANHLTSRHRIRAGKTLKIPLRGYSYVEERGYKPSRRITKSQKGKIITYKVKKGSSLWLIARRYDTTVSEIKKMNGLQSNRLKVGQVLRIRSGSGKNSYVVRKGDCLGSIAEKHKLSVHELLKLNGLSQKDNIYPGQVIVVTR